MILLILILGLVLRLVNLNQSLWLDEAVQAVTAQESFSYIFQEIRGDFHPPLYHFLTYGWTRLFGFSEIALRLPSVFFGVATVWVVYKIAKLIFTSEMFNPPLGCAAGGKSDLPATSDCGATPPRGCKTPSTSASPAGGPKVFLPLVAALFLATAPFHIYYSQEARIYAMTAFFATLSIYSFLKMLIPETFTHSRSGPQAASLTCQPRLTVAQHHSGSVKLFTSEVVWYILSTTLLLYSDYYGFLVLLAQVIAVAILTKKRFSCFLLSWFFCLLFFLPWLPMFWVQVQNGLQATQVLPGWGKLVNVNFFKALPLTLVKFSLGRITIFNKKLYALVAGVLFILYGGVIAKGINDQYSAIRKKKKLATGHWPLATVLLWLFLPLLSVWLLSLFIPNYQPFHLLLVLPAFYLLLTYGASRFSTTILPSIIVAVLVVNLIALSVYYFNPYFHREDWRGVVKYVESQEKAVALLPSDTSNWPWRYYSTGKAELISVSSGVKEVDWNDLSNLTIQQSNNSAIYYIRYLALLFDPQEQIHLWLVKNGFDKIREVSFNQIPVWIYEEP